MTIFDAVLLGLVQALGEFLPISSSAHLVLLPYLRGQQYQGLAFDVMLHAATLLAVLLYFGKDWYRLIKDGLFRPKEPQGRLLWYLALATVPAGIAGLALGDWAENVFRNPLLIAACLIVFAAGFMVGRPESRQKRGGSPHAEKCACYRLCAGAGHFAGGIAQWHYHYGGPVFGVVAQL